MKQKIALFFATFIFLLLVVVNLLVKELSKPINIEQDIVIDILYGDSIYKVADKLYEKEILKYPKLWVWYGRAFGLAEKIKAGEYKIVSGATLLCVLDDFVKGNAVKYYVVMIEGKTITQTLKNLQSSEGIVSTLDPTDDSVILKSVEAEENYNHSEGLFYPDTYQYTKGAKDRDILKKAHERLIKELNEVWATRAKNLPYKTPYELLIMASIVERESGSNKERPQIAGVFVERLNRGMRLQTDPTVIYGMGENYKGRIRRKDLTTPTPYNTYTIDGLPPTPISLVSRASLEAAAHPLLNGMIFFVAKGNGYHVFSKTLSEHNRAVREYQLKRKKDYRSTPVKCETTNCEK
jgi:UPF0755 protein